MTSPAPSPAEHGSDPHPVCYRHPRRETGVRCVRCDRPICPDCMRPAAVGFQCPDDAGRDARSVRRATSGLRVGSRRPFVTWALIGLNVAVYAYTALHGINSPQASPLFVDWLMQPDAVARGDEYRLLTSAFLHVSVLHLVLNMFALAVVGPYLEPQLGRSRYLAVYLFGAVGGSTAIFLFGSRYGAVAGASGAIFGLFAAALLLVRELGIDLSWLVGTIVLNFVVTFTVPDISWLGHLGGFLTGALATAALAGVPVRAGRRRIGRRGVYGQGLQLVALAGLLALLVALRTVYWPKY